MKRDRAMGLLFAAALAAVPLGAPGTVPTAEAAALQQPHREDDCAWSRGRDWRARGCDADDRRERRGRDDGDWGRRRWADWDGWSRFRHDDWGDCFRTPWGLACETDRPGVYRVRDGHPGDEPGLDCDVLIVEDWGFRCIDSPRR